MVELKQELVTMKACFLVTGFVVAFATNQNFVHFSRRWLHSRCSESLRLVISKRHDIS